jgi:CDP-glycerol glycerophosphotransferase
MHPRVTAWAVAFLKRYVRIRIIYRAVRTRLRFLYFRWLGRGPSDPSVIIFECFLGRRYGGSPRALYEAMLDDPRFAESRFVWPLRNPAHAAEFDQLADPRTSVVKYRSPEYYRSYGRARTWISNSILAPELVPRHGQIYVQTWHGTPLKRIGLDVIETTETALNGKAEIDDRYRLEATKVTKFLSASPFTTRVFASAFGLPADGPDSPFVETGNPRNDTLVAATAADAHEARARFGIPADKRVVLYAPTWRDDQHDPTSGYVYRDPLDVGALRKALGDEYVVLFRMHYLITNNLDLAAHQGFAIDVSSVDEINELCLASDVLVTDYSSVYFDFALLDRPMVFYMHDVDRYGTALRGFYFPVSDVPGPMATTQDELVAALLDPDLSAKYADQRAELNARMSPRDDGHARARVLDLIAAQLAH